MKTAKGEKNITIYLAAPLFGIAERTHNLRLANELRTLGYTVILPQEEATNFICDGRFDLPRIVENCAKQASQSDVIVANLDGPDADSGTSLEVGIALRARLGLGSVDKIRNPNKILKPVVICVRTDFRTARGQEVGINGMFELADSIIYVPALVTSLKDINNFYKKLTRNISEAINILVPR